MQALLVDIHAPRGKPDPIPLATAINLALNLPNHEQITFQFFQIQFELHLKKIKYHFHCTIILNFSKNFKLAGLIPPSPCMGSIRIALIFSSIFFLISSISLKGI